MKKWLLITLASSVLWGSTQAYSDTVSIRADNWFPMNGDPKSATPGYMIELATRIFGDAGHTVDYRTMPWERAVKSVREGEFDCVVGAYPEDAPDFIYPKASWGLDEAAFYVKKNEAWRYTGLESLSTIKLGLVGGYAYDEAFDNYIKENNKGNYQFIKGDNALENNIKKILAGRLTATVESPLVMLAKLKEMGHQGEIVEAGKLGEPSDMYIACSPAKKSSKALINLVDEGTSQLRQSGELQKILDKYGLKDWK
jgi:polar amino acid transport system substrate-binding protein